MKSQGNSDLCFRFLRSRAGDLMTGQERSDCALDNRRFRAWPEVVVLCLFSLSILGTLLKNGWKPLMGRKRPRTQFLHYLMPLYLIDCFVLPKTKPSYFRDESFLQVTQYKKTLVRRSRYVAIFEFRGWKIRFGLQYLALFTHAKNILTQFFQ